jgi:hypothetical protein
VKPVISNTRLSLVFFGACAQTLKAAKPGVDGPCSGIVWSCKELYLSDADFASVFKMARTAFEALPKWKRDAEKKKAGLF